ncbi:MAG: 50S ribosomal protein L24e [Candidatus Methanosuratincola sp.]|jgi:large subunit ribosomal protein L24e|uniref:Large ribosomal subunit protein eL24 n=2 Tax=Candidatus Methanosuratincola (ex Vanwonterghem et al. 2016) TaxID=1915412 RepID=A0A7J3UXM7_9CREN|nr:50S ribosomal protein L24e [Candidatus Methanosuratincola sp.]MDI9609279.1 50S ribosomal protein L24e [Candidatus Verstraetearchaeota archaeon]RWX73560.1 MAG: LSU ribosomal protein L24e [Candidatus Methanosuratincola subterraneus]
MVRIQKCSFCSHEIPAGTGLMYVKNDGTILRFCSSKCRKNMLELKRVPRDLKWASSKV